MSFSEVNPIENTPKNKLRVDRINTDYINILVDYDNLNVDRPEDVPTVINHIVDRICATISRNNTKKNYDISVRLYGGWYGEEKLTRKAQYITTIIQDKYPDRNEKLCYFVSVELSRSLASRPSVDFLFTYRKRHGLGGVRICSDEKICCDDARNSIAFFKKLKKKKECPHCARPSSDLIWKDEQKLVDMMLAMDIVYFAKTENKELLAVVTSDEDFLPALFQTATEGKKVLHMHAKNNRKIGERYARIAPTENYTELMFEGDRQ